MLETEPPISHNVFPASPHASTKLLICWIRQMIARSSIEVLDSSFGLYSYAISAGIGHETSGRMMAQRGWDLATCSSWMRGRVQSM